MALIVKFSHAVPSIYTRSEFNVPISFRDAKIIAGNAKFVISVYADGHEHELILQRFKNLPSGYAGTFWTGEFARFIADNFISLCSYPEKKA